MLKLVKKLKKPEVTDFGYMLLHEDKYDLFYVVYKLKAKWGCQVFGRRKNSTSRKLILELAENHEDKFSAKREALFIINKVILKPKLFNIRD